MKYITYFKNYIQAYVILKISKTDKIITTTQVER